MSPERSDLVLSTDIPDVEFGVLVGDCLYVKADSWDGGHVLIEFELVQDGCGIVVSQLFSGSCNGLSDDDASQVIPCCCIAGHRRREGVSQCNLLVLPAASSPSISNRISLDPKTLAIILEIPPPIVDVYVIGRFDVDVCCQLGAMKLNASEQMQFNSHSLRMYASSCAVEK